MASVAEDLRGGRLENSRRPTSGDMVWAWLGEENARLLLLAGVLVVYMSAGAVLFNFVEGQPGEYIP